MAKVRKITYRRTKTGKELHKAIWGVPMLLIVSTCHWLSNSNESIVGDSFYMNGKHCQLAYKARTKQVLITEFLHSDREIQTLTFKKVDKPDCEYERQNQCFSQSELFDAVIKQGLR